MRKQARRTRRTPQPAPAGLAHAFKLVQVDATAIAAREDARLTYPHARRILDILHGDSQAGTDVAVQDELIAATQTMYGNVESGKDPCVAATAAFHVGFAVCWLLMTEMSGREPR